MKQMKRILSFVLALTMLVSMFSVAVFSTTAAEATTYIVGDADLDGSVNIFDATYIQCKLAKYADYEIEEGTVRFAAADADGDGLINIFDATFIQRHLAKYDDGYGIGEEKTFGGDEDPTKPTEDESVEGFYMVGKLNGVEYWDASQITPDRKLKDADGDGDYTLDWTFYDGDEIKVVAFDGTSITRWYKDGTDEGGDKNYKLTAEGNKTGLCTLTFNPNGKDTSIWSYKYFTVKQKEVVETEPTEEQPTQGEATGDQPTQATQPETEEPTTAPVGGPGYYLVGQLNGAQMWFVDDTAADRKLVYDEATGNYTIDWTFVVGDEIKVVEYDGTAITRWYKDANDSWTEEDQEKGNNNYRIGESKAGLGTLTFNPEGGIGSYGYFTVQPKPVVETEAPTAEPTQAETAAPTQGEATDDDPTVAETEEPTVVETEAPTAAPKADEGYYLVGTLNTADCWFVDDTAADRKLVYDEATGNYTIDWTFVVGDEIKVVKYDGTAITHWYKDANDSWTEEDQEKGNNNYRIGESKAGLGTLTFNPEGGIGSYGYFTVQPKPVVETEAPTAEPTQGEATDDDPTVAETEAPTAEPTEEPTQAETEEPTQNEATPDDPTVAETEEPTVVETEPETEEPTDPPVVIPAGYYLVGTLGGEDFWFVDENSADRMLTKDEATGNYTIDWTFVVGDEIKVVYFNGTEIERWFKSGEEITEDDKQDDGTYNNNYKISAEKAGEKTLTFNPEGGIGSYNYFTVPSTVTPVDYYLIGYINGADYGSEKDWENLGEYKFVDGKLVATFNQDSYVYLKDSKNANWYMFESYVTATTGTLKNTSTGTKEKMFVPGNVEVTFTLVDNGDDTFTLSYVAAQAPTEETVPEGGGSDITDDPVDLPAGYYLIGDKGALSSWRTPSKLTEDRLMTDEDNDGVYEISWYFEGGETVAAVYYDGTSIIAEYPDQNDGKGEYKIGVGSNKTGNVVVKCSTTVNLGSRVTFTVQPVG